jgi:hypothetical protein
MSFSLMMRIGARWQDVWQMRPRARDPTDADDVHSGAVPATPSPTST